MVGACVLRQILQVLGMCLHCTRPRQQGVQMAVHLAGMKVSGVPSQPAEVGVCSCHISVPALLWSLQRLVKFCQPPPRDVVFALLLSKPVPRHTASVGGSASTA